MQQKLSETVEMLGVTMCMFSSCALTYSSPGSSGGRGRAWSHWRRYMWSATSGMTLCSLVSPCPLRWNTSYLECNETTTLPAHTSLLQSYTEKRRVEIQAEIQYYFDIFGEMETLEVKWNEQQLRRGFGCQK